MIGGNPTATNSVSREDGAGFVLVRLSGEVDLSWSQDVRRVVLAAFAGDAAVGIELSAVGYIDSSGIAALVEGLRLHILWRVQREPEEVGDAALPFVVLPPDVEDDEDEDPEWADFPAGAGWAVGFLHGMGLREAAWSQRMEDNEDVADDVAMLFALSRTGDDEDSAQDGPSAHDEDVDGDNALDAEQRLDAIDVLADMLHDLHCLRIHELRPAPARREAEPGRNDECPCGSGRKYKKCCGAAS